MSQTITNIYSHPLLSGGFSATFVQISARWFLQGSLTRPTRCLRRLWLWHCLTVCSRCCSWCWTPRRCACRACRWARRGSPETPRGCSRCACVPAGSSSCPRPALRPPAARTRTARAPPPPPPSLFHIRLRRLCSLTLLLFPLDTPTAALRRSLVGLWEDDGRLASVWQTTSNTLVFFVSVWILQPDQLFSGSKCDVSPFWLHVVAGQWGAGNSLHPMQYSLLSWCNKCEWLKYQGAKKKKGWCWSECDRKSFYFGFQPLVWKLHSLRGVLCLACFFSI